MGFVQVCWQLPKEATGQKSGVRSYGSGAIRGQNYGSGAIRGQNYGSGAIRGQNYGSGAIRGQNYGSGAIVMSQLLLM